MWKQRIAFLKSHPYRRDNIEKVRRDEEEAKEESEDGRATLAVSSHVVQLDSKDLFTIGPSY